MTFVAALVFVLALILLIAWIMRRLGVAGTPLSGGGRARRLAVVEALALDPKRRLLLVRRDGVEHLLLLGNDSAVVVESPIRPAFAETLNTPDAERPA